jgi:ParB-like nuclease family protein
MNEYDDAPNVTPWGLSSYNDRELDDEEQRERERQELATHPPVYQYVPKGTAKQRVLAEFDAMADNAYKAMTSGSGLDRVIAAAAFRLRGTREADSAQVQEERQAVRQQAIGQEPKDDPYSAWASDDPYDRWADSGDEMAAGRAELERLRAGGVPEPERPGFEVPGQSVGNIAGTIGQALNPAQGLVGPQPSEQDVRNNLFGTAAPEGSNPVVQELLRPANYIGTGAGVRGLVRGAASGVGARFFSDTAVEAVPEDAPPWVKPVVGLGAGLAGGVAGFGAPEIAGAGRRALGAADAALNPANLRGAAPEAFERGRGNYLGNELQPNAIRPGDAIPRRLTLAPEGAQGGIAGAAERTGKPTEREIAALKAKIAREGLTDENRAANMELLGRSLGAMTPEAQAAAAPWNAPAPPPTTAEALRRARIEERVGNRLGRGPDSPSPEPIPFPTQGGMTPQQAATAQLPTPDLGPVQRSGGLSTRFGGPAAERAQVVAGYQQELATMLRDRPHITNPESAAAWDARIAELTQDIADHIGPRTPVQGGMLGMPDRPTLRPENTPTETQGAMFDRAKYRRSFKRPAPKVPEFPLFGEGVQGGAVDTLEARTSLAQRIPREQWVSPSEIDTRPDLFQARDAPAGQATDPRRVKQIVDNFQPERFEPITVVREGDRYVVISGHHRLEAAQQLGLPEIPLRVVQGDISTPASRMHLQNEAAIANFTVAEPNVRELWRAARTLEANGEDLVSIGRQLRHTTEKVQRALDIGLAGDAVMERAVSVPATADLAAEVGRGVRLYGINQEDAFALFDAYATRAKGERPLSPAAVRKQIDRLAPELGRQGGLPGFEASETGAPVFEAMREAARVQDELLKAERRAGANLRGVQNIARESGIEAPELVGAGEAKLAEIRTRLQDVEAEAVARIRAQRAEAQAARAMVEPEAVAENLGPQQTGPGLFDDQSGNVRPGAGLTAERNTSLNPMSVSRVQASPLSSSTQATSPSVITRTGAPSSTQGPSRSVAPFGIDPSSHKPILHDRDDAGVLINVARAAAPQLSSALDTVAAEVGGAVVGPRIKSEASLALKIARGVNPASSSDYLGARLVVIDTDGAFELLTAGRRVVADDLSQRFGYSARHVSVEVTPGFSAEVQIMEPRIAAAQEFAHVYYDRMTKGGAGVTMPEAVVARLEAASQYMYEHAPAVTPERAAEIQRAYQAGNHTPPPELADVVREANRIATGAAIEPNAASYVDVRPGAAHGPLGPAEAEALRNGPVDTLPGTPMTSAQAQRQYGVPYAQAHAISQGAPPPVAAAGAGAPPPTPPRPPAPSGYGAMPEGAGPPVPFDNMAPPPAPKGSWADTFADIMGIPLAWKTTYDLSGGGRQLAPMLYAHPTAIGGVIRAQAKALRSQAAFDASQDLIRNAPDRHLLDIAGVELSGITDGFVREENLGSKLGAKILPGSQRFNDAYAAAINQGRVWLFRNMLAHMDPTHLTEAGLRSGGADELKKIGQLVNASTGRGDLAKHLTDNKILGQPVLWAPKLIAGRVQLVTSVFSRNKQVRLEAARQVIAFAGINMAILGTIKATGAADVELDPRSSDWGTIRIGNRRWDPWAGYKSIVNLVARSGVGLLNAVQDGDDIPNMKRVNRPGAPGTLYSKPGMDVIVDFLRSKLAPVAGEAVNQYAEKDVTGADVTRPWGGVDLPLIGKATGRVEHALAGLLAPIFAESLAEELTHTVPIGSRTGGAAGAALEVGKAVASNVPYFLGAGGGYYTPDAGQKAAEGGYRKLGADDQFDARGAETWRRLRGSPEFKAAVADYGSMGSWYDAKEAKFKGLLRTANPSWSDVRVQTEAKKAVERHAVYKQYLATRTFITDDWVTRNPRLAQEKWDTEVRRNPRMPAWQPTTNQRAIIAQALGEAVAAQ